MRFVLWLEKGIEVRQFYSASDSKITTKDIGQGDNDFRGTNVFTLFERQPESSPAVTVLLLGSALVLFCTYNTLPRFPGVLSRKTTIMLVTLFHVRKEKVMLDVMWRR